MMIIPYHEERNGRIAIRRADAAVPAFDAVPGQLVRLRPAAGAEQGVDAGMSRDKNLLRRYPLRQEVAARPLGGREM
jgi:hypothetical protein